MASPTVEFQSISLLLDEPTPLKGPSIASLLPTHGQSYRLFGPSKNTEYEATHLSYMPEVFVRKLSAYSKYEFVIVNQLYRMAEMIRYNFSNGAQVSAKEILRMSLHRLVPEEFLPQLKSSHWHHDQVPMRPWALTQTESGPEVRPTEEIIQSLLNRVVTGHRQKRLKVLLQTHSQSTKSLPLQTIELDVENELDWRVDFEDRKRFKTEFKIVSSRHRRFYFYDSYAFEPENAIVVVHPWRTEFSQLQERLSAISETLILDASAGMPAFELSSEAKIKDVIKYLRSRALPVKITGDSHTVDAHKSQTEVRFTNNGHFVILHEARVPGQKNIQRQGWSQRSAHYLMCLSQGLPYALETQARDIASTDSFQRDWDLALLKHLGILQYIFLETLSVHFEKTLIDGTPVSGDAVFPAIQNKVKLLLITTRDGDQDTATLADFVSRSTLACFDRFVDQIQVDVTQGESFYSESGEVIMDGILQREFRLIYELLKRLALTTQGSCFKKVRAPFLNKISASTFETESTISQAKFYFPEASLGGALEITHNIVPFGFKIFLNDHPIQELSDSDLDIKFNIADRMDQSQINWFELCPKFFLMGQEIDPIHILRLGTGGVIEYENKLYLVPQKQIPSLRLLEDFWKKLQKSKIESSRRGRDSYYQLPRSQTLFLLALRKAGIPFQGDAEWLKLCEFYDRLGETTRSPELPSSIKAELKIYQKTGVQWLQDLYKLKLGALLADDMGLGKTLQTLSFLEDLRVKKEMGTVLVVVPSSLVFNWRNEIEKFTPEIPVALFSNDTRENIAALVAGKKEKLVLITYGLMLEHAEVISRSTWNIIVFDEAQNIKNINSKRTTAARGLKARFRIALTGTPMENHFGEFYSLIDLLVPGSLGPLEDFRRGYVYSPVVDYELIQNLKLKIKPLVLRRAKKEILDQLPPKQETVVKIAFEEEQKEIYRNVALSFNRRIHEVMSPQGVAQVQLEMFTALLRLRQVCSDPAALPDVKYEKVPPKLETLVDCVKEITESGESVLIFTQFLQTLEHTEKLLKESGVPVLIIHGGVSTGKRQKVIAEFSQTTTGTVLLMTLKTGGVGLNLTKASYVFHIEPWWNPAVENQATDRAHRMGQTKAVQVFKYIMHESLEEKIEILKERKDQKFQSLFTDRESRDGKENETASFASTPRSLSKDDFEQLIKC
jgi:superfamily II DNA or RNA helicase